MASLNGLALWHDLHSEDEHEMNTTSLFRLGAQATISLWHTGWHDETATLRDQLQVSQSLRWNAKSRAVCAMHWIPQP